MIHSQQYARVICFCSIAIACVAVGITIMSATILGTIYTYGAAMIFGGILVGSWIAAKA